MGLLLCPQRPDHLDVLVGPLTAFFEGRPERVELGLQIAGAEAEYQPSTGEDVHARQFLGEDERVALWKDDDPRAQPDRARVGPHMGKSDCRVEKRRTGGYGRKRYLRVWQHDVLCRP
jgi:hypothetical protein